MRQAYLDLQEKHRQEISDFPIAYAFNKQQMEEALGKLGATKEECVTIFGHGDIVKKENAQKFIEMLKRHTKEVKDALLADNDFAEAAFLYEMDNHEYAINWSGDDDVLSCFGLDYDDLVKLNLMDAYRRARQAHFKRMEEWGVI
jgi:hypothetical protein